MIKYHHNMIHALVEITVLTYPMTQLLKRNAPEKIKWQPCRAHRYALKHIKRILRSKPVLVATRLDGDFIVLADSSDKTTAAILA
jgi:hypothetical protein